VVAALPQRQLRAGDGERAGELRVELGTAGRCGPLLCLLEPAARSGKVAPGDVQPGPLPPGVDALGAGEPVPLQDSAQVPVGLLPAAEWELEHEGLLLQEIAPR
jgi:hypothetical protein